MSERNEKNKSFVATVITIMGVVVITFVYFHGAIRPSTSDSISVADSFDSFLVPDVQGPLLASAVVPVDHPNRPAGQNTSQASSGSNKTIKKNSAWPASLVIPKIHVDAGVQYVGVTTTGTMAVPNSYSDVGWYRGGTIPGDPGTAVFDGHVDNGFGLQAVFWNLSKLKEGDTIEIVTNAGKQLEFRVTSLQTYAYDDPAAAAVIFSQTEESTLKLITCSGSWVSGDKTYSRRLVVTAELDE